MSLAEFESYSGPTAEIGVIGGSGLYSLLDGMAPVSVETPWGPPSDALMIGEAVGRSVAFLPRHGRGHRFPPHRINYRANLWAMRMVGVRQVLAPCAVGSLQRSLGAGSFIVPDQLVDRTWGRGHTFFDGAEGVCHVSFADPFCPNGRAALLAMASASGLDPVGGGTLVVINGPRFSSRAESLWHGGQGWSIVGMTAMPEAALARELALCYSMISLVTDHDAGFEEGDAVSQEQVFAVFAGNIGRMREALLRTIAALPVERDCPCPRSLDGFKLPFALP